MIHSAIQTVVSEVYASDEWEEYAKKVTGAVKNAIADKNGEGKVKERYNEIVKLAEVDSLSKAGKFTSAVIKDGKVMTIIYKNGKGQIGIYFGETKECIAYDESEFANADNYFTQYSDCVTYTPGNNDNFWINKNFILRIMGLKE